MSEKETLTMDAGAYAKALKEFKAEQRKPYDARLKELNDEIEKLTTERDQIEDFLAAIDGEGEEPKPKRSGEKKRNNISQDTTPLTEAELKKIVTYIDNAEGDEVQNAAVRNHLGLDKSRKQSVSGALKKLAEEGKIKHNGEEGRASAYRSVHKKK